MNDLPPSQGPEIQMPPQPKHSFIARLGAGGKNQSSIWTNQAQKVKSALILLAALGRCIGGPHCVALFCLLEMLCQLQALSLIIGPAIGITIKLGRRAGHLFIDQPTDNLILFNQERHIM